MEVGHSYSMLGRIERGLEPYNQVILQAAAQVQCTNNCARGVQFHLTPFVREVYIWGINLRNRPMIKNLLLQMAQELEFQLETSKGGGVRGITEDHRYEMLCQLQTLRSTIAGLRGSRAA
ncbi:MAG TPA: hypothetical protein VIM11_26865 [Tepidisphaeraceae bacterium]